MQIKGKYRKNSISEAIACWKLCKEEAGAQGTRDGSRVSTSEGDKHPSASGQGHGEVTPGQRAGGEEASRACVGSAATAGAPEAGRVLMGLRPSQGPRARRRARRTMPERGAAGESTRGLQCHMRPCLLLSVADRC